MTITLRGTKGSALTFGELDGNFTDLEGQIDAHLADAADAHDASAISVVATGGISSTDVQAALAELDTEKLGSTHSSTTSSTHGVTGDIVGTSDTQTLTNKTIVVGNNTLTVSAAGVTATELNAALVELAAAIAGLPTVTVQTGYVSSDTTTGNGSTVVTTGTGEDLKYVDVTISAVSGTANCEVIIDGAASNTSLSDSNTWNGTTPRRLTARLTSTTNLRVSCSSSVAFIQLRWQVIDHGA